MPSSTARTILLLRRCRLVPGRALIAGEERVAPAQLDGGFRRVLNRGVLGSNLGGDPSVTVGARCAWLWNPGESCSFGDGQYTKNAHGIARALSVGEYRGRWVALDNVR